MVPTTLQNSFSPTSPDRRNHVLRESPKASCVVYRKYAATTAELTAAASKTKCKKSSGYYWHSVPFWSTIQPNMNTLFSLAFEPKRIWIEYSVPRPNRYYQFRSKWDTHRIRWSTAEYLVEGTLSSARPRRLCTLGVVRLARCCTLHWKSWRCTH